MYLKNQSRKQKKGGMVCIVTLMLALSFGGCGDKEKKADTTAVTKENETTTVSQEETGQSESEFDFSQVYDNIELNGKKIPFPFTLNDLGEEYDFNGIYSKDEEDSYFTILMHNDEIIAYAYILAENEQEINRDSLVFGIELYCGRKQEFKIKGVNCENKISDIDKVFINLPTKLNDNGVIYKYSARNNEGRIFDISIDDNEISIITVKEEK